MAFEEGSSDEDQDNSSMGELSEADDESAFLP